MRLALLTAVQALGLALAALGLFLLAGPAWTALAVGVAVCGLASLAELATPRPRPAPVKVTVRGPESDS